MDKRLIKKFLYKNLYICEIANCIAGYTYNKKMNSFIEILKGIDSITDSAMLADVMEKIPENFFADYYSLRHSYSENTLYGYAYEVMKYAGINEKDIFYMPLLEHGISDTNTFYGNLNSAYIFQGKYKEEYLRSRNLRNIYFIGPYIHYVCDYYTNEYFLKFKKKIGKTLLIFPPHSTECDKTDYNLSAFTDYVLNDIGKKFDSILACVYWANLNDSYVSFLRENGIKIVSAGFKLDPLFVCRLKSIISLSDTVLYPSFTTSIGFAYYLKKQIIFKDNFDNIAFNEFRFKNDSSNVSVRVMDELREINKIFSEIFSEESIPFSSEQNALINKYWGLSEIKSPDEIRKILKENKSQIIRRLGF